MHERLNKVRKENPDFDKKMVDSFAEKMPKLLSVLIDGTLYDNHIGSKEVAMLAEPYIVNDEGEHIGFHWDYDTVIDNIKNYVDFDETEAYEADYFVWANVKYGDMAHIDDKTSDILRYTVAELNDKDYPFYPASQRAYCWLKKHIENEEKTE